MKIVFAALGLVLLFIGLITVVFANIRYENWSPPMSVGLAHNCWSVSGNYSSNDGLYVNIAANLKWLDLYELGDPDTIFQYGYNIVFVDVIDPYGNKTRFQYRWVRWPNSLNPSEYVILPESTTILQNGSLIDSESLKSEYVEPSGVVRYSGTYTANITGMWYQYPKNPPASIELVKLVTISVEPYSYALPVGVAGFIGGVAASIYGVKSQEHQNKGQKRRVKAKIRKIINEKSIKSIKKGMFIFLDIYFSSFLASSNERDVDNISNDNNIAPRNSGIISTVPLMKSC